MQIGIGLGLTNNSGVMSPSAFLGASLLAQWDAERVDKVALSGSSVTGWTDVVGNYAALQATGAAQPQYSATSFNGRPGITFDGVDDYLELASQPFPSGAAASEIWALVDQTALPADTGGRRVFSYGDATNTTRELYRAVVTGVNRATGAVGDGAARVFPQEGTRDLSGRHVMRLIVSPTAATVETDGTAGGSTSVVPATGTVRARIGATAVSASPSLYWQGVQSTILVTGALTTAQATQLYAYLNSRKG